jgi:hypothetical protein
LFVCFVFFFLRRTTHNNRAHENLRRQKKIWRVKTRERGGKGEGFHLEEGEGGGGDYSDGKWDVGGFLVGFITKEEHKFKKLPDNTVR